MNRSCNAAVSLVLSLPAAIAGCDSSTAVSSRAESISVTVGTAGSRNLTMNKGELVPLTVVSRDAKGQIVQPGGDFVFVSRSAAVATVSSTGIVTGQDAGATYVVASLSTNGRTMSDSIQVHVVVVVVR